MTLLVVQAVLGSASASNILEPSSYSELECRWIVLLLCNTIWIADNPCSKANKALGWWYRGHQCYCKCIFVTFCSLRAFVKLKFLQFYEISSWNYFFFIIKPFAALWNKLLSYCFYYVTWTSWTQTIRVDCNPR